ncbi:MAG: hypothetical protein EOL87_02910 [Spartobacteria bacterium]|nr:hypothetical protein [Spartobacteria bacterium]
MADTGENNRTLLFYVLLIIAAAGLAAILFFISQQPGTSSKPIVLQQSITYIALSATPIPTSTPCPAPPPVPAKATAVPAIVPNMDQRLSDARQLVYDDPNFVLSELKSVQQALLTVDQQERYDDLTALAFTEIYFQRVKAHRMKEAETILRFLEEQYPESPHISRAQKQWGDHLKREWRRLHERVPSRADMIFEEWSKKAYRDHDEIFMEEIQRDQLRRFATDLRYESKAEAQKRLIAAAQTITDLRSLGAFSRAINQSALTVDDLLEMAADIEAQGLIRAPLAIPFYIALNDRLNQGIRDSKINDYSTYQSLTEFIQDKMVDLTLLTAEAIQSDQSALLTAYNPVSFYQNAIDWARNPAAKATALGSYLLYLITELEELITPLLATAEPEPLAQVKDQVSACESLYHTEILPTAAMYIGALIDNHPDDADALRSAAIADGFPLDEQSTLLNQNRTIVLAVRQGKWLPETDRLKLIGLMMKDLKERYPQGNATEL